MSILWGGPKREHRIVKIISTSVSDDTLAAIELFRQRNGLNLAAAIRLLIEGALDRAPPSVGVADRSGRQQLYLDEILRHARIASSMASFLVDAEAREVFKAASSQIEKDEKRFSAALASLAQDRRATGKAPRGDGANDAPSKKAEARS